MKAYKSILPCILFALAITASHSSQAQETRKSREQAKEVKMRDLIESQNYVFKAQTVLPMRGRTRQLTTDYDLAVSPDTLQAYLPYFGRAYSAPMDPSKGGIRFTSVKFDYTQTARKKGGWSILIKPKDVEEIQQLVLSVSNSGYGTLQVISTQRDPISFTGYIAKK
jgi:hypothetical protein